MTPIAPTSTCHPQGLGCAKYGQPLSLIRRTKKIILNAQYVLSARFCAKHFIYIISLNLKWHNIKLTLEKDSDIHANPVPRPLWVSHSCTEAALWAYCTPRIPQVSQPLREAEWLNAWVGGPLWEDLSLTWLLPLTEINPGTIITVMASVTKRS